MAPMEMDRHTAPSQELIKANERWHAYMNVFGWTASEHIKKDDVLFYLIEKIEALEKVYPELKNTGLKRSDDTNEGYAG